MSIKNAGRRGLFGLLAAAPVAAAAAGAKAEKSPAIRSGRPVTGNELGMALCKVLGIDPEKTGKIVIDSTPGQIAKISIEQFVTDEDTGRLAIVLNDYELADRQDGAKTAASDGTMNIDARVEAVERRMAGRLSRGRGSLGKALERTYGLIPAGR